MRMLMMGAAALLLAGCDRGGDEEAASAEDAATGASARAEAGASASAGAGPAASIRPGMWRVTTEAPGGVSNVEESCVTPSEARFDPSQTAPLSQDCRQTSAVEGGAIVVRASCPGVQGAGKMDMEMRAQTQGDSAYTINMVTRIDTVGGEQTFTTTARGQYLGPCPAPPGQ